MPLRRSESDRPTPPVRDRGQRARIEPSPERRQIEQSPERHQNEPSRFLRSIEPSRIDGLAGLCMLILVVRGLGLPLPGGHLAADAVLVVVGFQLGLAVRRLAGTERWVRRYWFGAIGPVAIPAVVAVGLAIVYWASLGRLDGPALRGAIGALTMTANTVPVVADADFPATSHLWLVAVIVQFAFVVPLAVLHARRAGAGRSVVRIAFSAAATVAAVRLALALTGRIEASTLAQLTRFDGLLVGAGLALAPSYLLRRLPSTVASPALASLLVVFVLSPNPAAHPVIAFGLLSPLIVVATAAVVACQTRNNRDLATGRLLNLLVFRWLGERAIGIFIWHQLFGMVLTGDGTTGVFGADWPGPGLFVTQLVFALAAGAASYRHLQLPFLSATGRPAERAMRDDRTADVSRPPALNPG